MKSLKSFLSSPWLKRIIASILAVLVLFGAYRLVRYISPAAPDVYKIAIDPTWYPLDIFGKEHSFSAFTADLLFAIARDQKIRIEIVRTGPRRLMELVDDEIVDGALTSLLPDQKTESEYYFSDPFYRYGAVLILPKKEPFESLQKLSGKKIGVRRNSPILYRLSIDPKASIVSYDSPMTALEDLRQHRMDGILFDQLLLYLYFGTLYRSELKVATKPLTQEGLRLVTLQEGYTEDLIEKFNTGLKNLKENGTYSRLLDQWEVYDPEIPQ